MKKKLVLLNVIILTAAILTMFVCGLAVARDERLSVAKREIVDIANIYAANYDDDIASNVPSNIRLTIFDAAGVAIKDSQSAEAIGVSHVDREEIQSAFSGAPAVVTRYSDTLKKEMAYYAVKVDTDDTHVFVRVAIAVDSVNEYISKSVFVMVFVLIVVLGASYFASVAVSDSFVNSLKIVKNNLEAVKNDTYIAAFSSVNDKEINSMLVQINDISDKLHEYVVKEADEKRKLDYVLENISDGIVVLSKDGNVLSINKNAGDALNLSTETCKNKYLTVLSADKTFAKNTENCVKNAVGCDFDYSADEKYYLVSARHLENDVTVVVLSDITAIKTSEKTRSDFFANASHELKTPLTAIKGFNDIIGMQTNEQSTKELSQKIDVETTRIISLLKDMLDLSSLEAKKEIVAEDVNLREVALSVVQSLSSVAKEKQVNISVEGSAIVKMEKEHAFELVKNLVENGVLYNRPGGHVDVRISADASSSAIVVADDGIGIEEKHLQRIFERFYRVNKSRSRETGGTGLGLAIVKHVCSLYDADISVMSKLGVGTTATVRFDRK